MLETVDAEWFAEDYGGSEALSGSDWGNEHEESTCLDANALLREDQRGGLEIGPPIDSLPPVLNEAELAILDAEAEEHELERLVSMGVLKEQDPNLASEKLTVTFVHTWKHGGERPGWWRRARLVARQYKWASLMGDEETFSPASVVPLARHLLLLAQNWDTPIWVCDVKDAYLNVAQPEDEPVVVMVSGKWWQLGRVLPGQRRGAQAWWVQLQGDLQDINMEGLPEVPTLMRSLEGRQAMQVHVDDMLMTGDVDRTDQVSGPFNKPGDEWEFLKRRFTIEEDGSITVRPAARFYIDIYDLLERPRHRSTPGPGAGDSLFQVDDSEILNNSESSLFRTVVGKLLYMSNERPDAQVVIQYLAGKASSPSKQAMRVLKHLAGYLHATQGFGVNLRNSKGWSVLRPSTRERNEEAAMDTHGERDNPAAKDLIEVISDSNFANDRSTRKSLSSGQIYINQALMYSFVRGQKVVTLSSGEAELVALTQAVSEGILIQKAWEFLVDDDACMVARTDSSVARAISQRAGVGRVRHLQTSCLWIQQWVSMRRLRVAAIPTEMNPADAGTKILTAKRLQMLCGVMGIVNEDGTRVGTTNAREDLHVSGLQLRRALKMVQAVLTVQLQGCANVGENGQSSSIEETFYVMRVIVEGIFEGIFDYVFICIYYLQKHFDVFNANYVVGGLLMILVMVVIYVMFVVQWRITIDVRGGGRQRGLEHGYVGPSTEGAYSKAAFKEDLSPTTRTARTPPTTQTSASSSTLRSFPATPMPKTSTTSERIQRLDPSPSGHEASQEASSSGAQSIPEAPTSTQNESSPGKFAKQCEERYTPSQSTFNTSWCVKLSGGAGRSGAGRSGDQCNQLYGTRL